MLFETESNSGLRVGDLIEVKGIAGYPYLELLNYNKKYKVAYITELQGSPNKSVFVAIPPEQNLTTPITSINTGLYTFYSTSQASFTNDLSKFEDNTTIIPLDSPGGKATLFTANALKGKVFIVRVNKSRTSDVMKNDSDYDAGSQASNEKNYLKDIYDRTLGTIFYKVQDVNIIKYREFVYSIFQNNKNSAQAAAPYNYQKIKLEVANSISSPIFRSNSEGSISSKVSTIISVISNKNMTDHATEANYTDIISVSSAKTLFNEMVELRRVTELYENASKWPFVMWDEYYEDGTPVTLNWELVTNNLANVYTNDLLTQSSAAIEANEAAVTPRKV